MRTDRLIYFLSFLIFIIATGWACAYAKKDVITTPCVLPVSVSYATDIAPIIETNCSGCHTGSSPSSGISLDNYDGLNFYARNGYLYGCITHASGYKPMPDGGGKLSDCTIATIKLWIDAGTPR